MLSFEPLHFAELVVPLLLERPRDQRSWPPRRSHWPAPPIGAPLPDSGRPSSDLRPTRAQSCAHCAPPRGGAITLVRLPS
jgi:hypothetical protein